MYCFGNELQIRRSFVRIITLLLSLSLVMLLSPPASRVQAQTDLTIHFQGPETTHISYARQVWHPNCGIEFSVVEPSNTRRVIAQAEGENPAFSGEYRDQGLVPGTYVYQIRSRIFDEDEQEWLPWSVVVEKYVDIDGKAQGTLLFDESLTNAQLASVVVPDGKTLTVSGTLSGTSSSKMVISGTLEVSLGVEILPLGFYGVRVFLYSENHLTNVTGGNFTVEEQGRGSSFTDSYDIWLIPRAGVTLNNVQNANLIYLDVPNDQELEINDSVVIGGYAGPFFSCATGKIIFNQTIVEGEFRVRDECSVEAFDSTFNERVEVGDSAATINEDVYFYSQDSRFSSPRLDWALSVTMAAPGNVSLANSLFSDNVAINGGYPTFTSCEFGSSVAMYNRNGATIEGNLFLGPLYFFNSLASYDESPFWHLGNSPSPTIKNNAFMGEEALWFAEDVPQTPLPIGRNYYGDKAGYFRGGHWSEPGYMKHGFLGYHSGHAGALDQSLADALAIAPHFETSPVSGVRRDTRVLPKFWVNGHIVGQNTLAHDEDSGPLLKGRDTLLSVHLVASDDNLKGVRVYAAWDGQEIEAANNRNNLPLHRDHSLYSQSATRYGNVTYNFILPGVDYGSAGETLNMPVEVYLDVSAVPGFDAEAYPETDRLLFSKNLFFTALERPLRIAVQPIEVKGLFGGSWGVANPAGVMQTLRTDLPEMLPIPAGKVELTRLPTRTFWSPSSSISTAGLMSRIAAGVGLARGWTDLLSDYAPDFVVVVLPKGLVGQGFDGAAYAWSSRILFVAEHKADAVLHELGHGIGLYTGWGNEQYELHPPNGLPVERVTRFYTETPVRRRIDHLPGSTDFWYDLSDDDFYYMDIMGSIGPVWTMPETVQSFHNWFKANLVDSQATSLLVTPAAASSTRRILISGAIDPAALDNGALMPETVFTFDVTGLDFPDIATGGTVLSHNLRAYDTEGTQILYHSFALPFYSTIGGPSNRRARMLVATFDLPAETAFFCIYTWDRLVDEELLIHCTHPTGLQATELLSPRPGDAIGAQFEAEWTIQATGSVNEAHLLHAPFYKTAVNEAHLLHTLYYKTAPDGSWQFGLMTQGTEVSVPSSFLPDTDYLALRLLSSDGLTRVEHVVEDLTVSERPPQVTIFSPQDGDQSEAGIAWQLSATAEDFSGAGLQPGRWYSSLEGDLGEGPSVWRELITGTHVLRYDVMSNNGLTGTSAVTVTVHDVMDALDLGLEESDLTLHNASLDPAGYAPAELIPGAANTFVLYVRNQGVDTSARARLFVRGPEDVEEALIGEAAIVLEPFEVGYVQFDFEPEAAGDYEVRAVIDQVVPPDPDMSNNERTWIFTTSGVEGAQEKIYLPLVLRGYD